ncbi:hypothetical protein [Bifidobacterium aerophilum]|uniref:Uncharacterized protein n=1 Tax=Bifidobacterium aerophilum TaxID=1798155 RepID=A0A6N9Z6N2_9BIFI|nr:hypothetical protein [Bifidobacterium aerophilum]NEG90282.1 hypothetical protein [Bifidobacterium aerophilum]
MTKRTILRILWWIGLICQLPTAWCWIDDRTVSNVFSGLPLSCDLTQPNCDTMSGIWRLLLLTVVGYAVWIAVAVLRIVWSGAQDMQGDTAKPLLLRIVVVLVTIGMPVVTLPVVGVMVLTVMLVLGW